ncbi:guanylate kinase [candidate division KSB1 bacterium]|nr:guanylate kinase [candidate division KSB1 bacterium]
MIRGRKVDSKQALLAVLSSPSGGGKTSIIHRIIDEGDDRYRLSISATTRKKRDDEKNGRDYWFVTRPQFQRMIERQELLEYENVHSCYYGTPKKPVLDWLAQGKIILFDIDVKGAFTLKRLYPHLAVLIFIQPPDLETLQKRLSGRKSESEEQVRKRLQRAAMEMEYGKAFDHVVLNDSLDRATAEVKAIIQTQLEQNNMRER